MLVPEPAEARRLVQEGRDRQGRLRAGTSARTAARPPATGRSTRPGSTRRARARSSTWASTASTTSPASSGRPGGSSPSRASPSRSATVRGGPFKGKKIDVTADDNTLLMLDFGDVDLRGRRRDVQRQRGQEPQVEIFGRAGTINLTDGRPVAKGRRWRSSSWTRSAGCRAGSPRAARRRCADAAAGGAASGRSGRSPRRLCRRRPRPLLNLEHARHVLEIMLKADESASSGRAMDLTTTFALPDPAG